jgi:ribonuclease HI
MAWRRMRFKEKLVFVEVGDDGAPLVREGRATMKYKENDERTYRPSPANLRADDNLSLDLPVPAVSSTRRAPADGAQSVPADPADKDVINAWTDGGCIGNPGPAGIGWLIVFPDGRRMQAGEPLGEGTNNIAELTAVQRVLEAVPDRTVPLRIHTDSSYAIGMLTMGWKAKQNGELVARIRRLLAAFSDVRMIKVKGHAGHAENELVDRLANDAARTRQRQ